MSRKTNNKTIMRKYLIYIATLLYLLMLTGCSPISESKESGLAPADIYNKTLEFNGGSYNISEFASDGECTVEITGWETITSRT
jgi:hypothetical protein